MKTLVKNERHPRRYKPFKYAYLLDENGVIVARVNFSDRGLRVEHARGFKVQVFEGRVHGQFNLEGEADNPFFCPLPCGEIGERWDPDKKLIVCEKCGEPKAGTPREA